MSSSMFFVREKRRRAVWQVFFCLAEHDAEEAGELCSQDAPLLDAVGDGEAARQ